MKRFLAIALILTACTNVEVPTVDTDGDLEENEQNSDTTEVVEVVRTYPVVGTAQSKAFNNGVEISLPAVGDDFYGQNANYPGTAPSYTLNGDGTVTDNVTGLIWQKEYQLHTYNGAIAALAELGDGWRLPTVKEAYSLILFSGTDVTTEEMTFVPDGSVPFIDTDYFDFDYSANGDRPIDSQMLTSTVYVGLTMITEKAFFGVNFADGRIKGYPMTDNDFYMVRFVRGAEYGINEFVDNGDNTISDIATQLMWSKDDSGVGMDWQAALEYVVKLNEEEFLGYNDWRLPDAKELHSIVDYARSPQTTASAAISSLFNVTSITNEGGSADFPFFWTSTTQEASFPAEGATAAVYFCFGEALGYMSADPAVAASWIDVHGAGAQRSDPKEGNAADYPTGFGPQGDARRIDNYVRVVRNM